ncbi:rhodanese-like domain-containing protein 11, chloroplastic isoform X2 [Beta vulgaris subsp. vulgaris]|uniref:rhodanese-like domain-containing protein 11, chloroplastic isoform X2 n=1 Tax=Beta vulgaris subsp. vulgaris TaxID=3555 RepID=UPI00053F713E|nr:rhodanese-like domain-containing protein 11, chloroplastic isoform X2 [Beta vulgaris subsp. vulgaris]
METFGLLPLSTPKISPSKFHGKCRTNYSTTGRTFRICDPCYGQQTPIRKTVNWKVPRMQVVEEEYELRQMKDMAAARKRWEALAWVKGSTWTPIFDVDDKLDAGTLSRKATNFMMGGWWSGVPTLSYNSQFISKVEEKFSKDTDLIVACQKGLRSLAACELLCNAGYKNVFWVQGGLEAAEEEDLQREGTQPFKFAGIGGLSEFLGWTDQQRAAAAKEGWQYRLVFSARLLGLVIAADALYLGAQQVARYVQEIRSH